jgi:ribosomal protein S16
MIKITNKNKKLGNSVKKLEFKIIKVSKNKKIPMYHVVVSRKRSGNMSRLDKVGFFHFATRYYSKIRLLALDFTKIKSYVLMGASFHRSVFKFLM